MENGKWKRGRGLKPLFTFHFPFSIRQGYDPMERDNEADVLRPELTLDEFQQRLAGLDDAPAADATIFSDLDRPKLAEVRRAWPKLPAATRRSLVAAMAELGEENIAY